jgi:CheY-like chemotaxis protein
VFRGFRALVADDNAVNLEVASEALAQLNATVVTVENGREAVDAAAHRREDRLPVEPAGA